ncbi:sushi domain protein [Dictyocaulus viviparus]|uniref:Sushi domain protein n=1 Tax=Dictyocaulus viviparus TaxID=29172 RepID=A0A0D8XCE6_DICVI|nr:sushi domain protein [Dictyocaulus viviparus]
MSTVKLNILQCVVGLAIIRSNVLAVACPEVKPPVGGMITSTGQILEGSTVTASCNNGGTMNGPAILTCIGGQWYPREFGTCMENSLNAIPMPTSAASQALGGVHDFLQTP